MDRLPIIGGAYSARSPIASAQRCINYFPEFNPKDSPDPVTLYQRPGLRALANGPVAPVRGLYQASNGNGYCVIGNSVYYIPPTFALTHIGDLTGQGAGLVSMIDNGSQIMVVNGSSQGWQIDMATNAFSLINDPTGTFQGANRVDTIDTYILWNFLNSNKFGSTLSGAITFDGLYFAAKNGYPDPLRSIFCSRLEIVLLGSLKGEVWYNAGNQNFPFARLPGAYIEHGMAATYSGAQTDVSVFWLGQDLQGTGIVFRQRGYETRRISNHALELAIQEMAAGPGISDAIGYVHQQHGHVFYVLSFPAGDQTWVYDDAISDPMLAWHQRSWVDPATGLAHRDRTNCFASLYGLQIAGDWENGTLYQLDPNYYQDDLLGVSGPIQFIRGFPHAMFGKSAAMQTIPSNGVVLNYNEFWLNVEAGNSPDTLVAGEIQLRWSDDRGKSWSNPVPLSAGVLGEYNALPGVRAGGISRDRVYEIAHSIPAQVAISGAWVYQQLTQQNKAG